MKRLNQSLLTLNLTRQQLLIIPAIALAACIGMGFDSDAWAQLELQDRAKASEEAGKTPSPKKAEAPTAPGNNSDVKKSPTKFIRVKNDDNQEPLAMQTAITRYRPAKGDLVVDLIGAVHIGEGDYYRQLNNQFKHYDVVLYELVAPQGTRVPRGGKKNSNSGQSPLDIVSWMQGQAQSTLGLESQLEMIDYQQENLTHADMSPTQMGEKMAERGDTPFTIGLSAITEIMRQQNKPSNGSTDSANQLPAANLMDALGDPLQMKLMMANQFSDAGVMELGLGATLNQLLVVDRNAAALKVMQKEIVKGNKKIAIFYGAAHMPDFEKRLADDFGLQKTKQVWIDAWDLTKAGGKTPSGSTTKLLFKLLDELGR